MDNNQEPAHLVVEGYLRAAKMVADSNNFKQAELVYKSAVAIAERRTGDKSLCTGLALLELWYFYEKAGQEAKSAFIWDRLATFIVENSHSLEVL